MSRAAQSRVTELLKHSFLWIIVICAFSGLYLMLEISLKDNQQFAESPWIPTAPFHWENYIVGWNQVAPYILNTVFVAVTIVVVTLVLAMYGAFFFARFKMPGGKFIFFLFLMLMMYPAVANMVPAFILIKQLGLYNSYWALILPGIIGGQAFTIFVLRGFIEDIPQDFFDAAEIDGCSMWRQVWQIVFPLSGPIVGTLAILAIIGRWNDFVAPLIYIRDPAKQLLAVGLLQGAFHFRRGFCARS
jgi:ABC-type glycerol-3-phosphate transport system permease component